MGRQNQRIVEENKKLFIKQFIDQYGDKKYDLSNICFENQNKKITVYCNYCEKDCNPSTPYNLLHLKKGPCDCQYTQPLALTCGEVIKKVKEKWGDRFGFEKMKYQNNRTPVILICKPCGEEFTQRISDTLFPKNGCYFCGNKKANTKVFIKKSIKVHGHLYDYSETEYKTSMEKVKIICKKHGPFWQQPGNHTNGKNGCPNCVQSLGEKEVMKVLDKLGISYSPQEKMIGMKFKDSLKFDFYFEETRPKVEKMKKLVSESRKYAIEFDGIQHFESVEHFGGQQAFELSLIKDKIKIDYCVENGISLVKIPYWRINKVEIIVKYFLRKARICHRIIVPDKSLFPSALWTTSTS